MKLTLPRGMRDIEPEEMDRREYVFSIIKEILNKYNFQFVEPSMIENLETLTAKSGPEIEKEIYSFKDKGDRKIALRFDLTVGLSRFISSKNMPQPTKIACISNMFRYDEPQYGRYRSFSQWDAEIFGSAGIEADAEIISLTSDILEKLGLDFEIRINNRKYVEGLFLENGVKQKDLLSVLRIIDKLSKLSKDEIKKEFKKLGIKEKEEENILEICGYKGKKIPKPEGKNKLLLEGYQELTDLSILLKKMNKFDKCVFDFSIVRGIDYYTGIVYEAWIKNEEEQRDAKGVKQLGAVAGGGRYDDLLATYGKPMPATGIAGGIERLLLSLKDKEIKKNPGVQVIFVNEKVFEKALEITEKIRKFIPADIDLNKRNFSNQLKYANSRKIPFVVIVGEKELQEKSIKLRDMETGKETLVPLVDLDKISSLVQQRLK